MRWKYNVARGVTWGPLGQFGQGCGSRSEVREEVAKLQQADSIEHTISIRGVLEDSRRARYDLRASESNMQ